jgi:biotin synthase
MLELIDKLRSEQILSKDELITLIDNYDNQKLREYLFKNAREVKKEYYSTDVYIRGIIEFSNYCQQDCYYCGIRKSNHNVKRYRLSNDEIINSCRHGYELGFRTFVLQSGEDPYFDDEKLSEIIKMIKDEFPDCALTLSIGERNKESYQRLYDVGADRYLLRHETANAEHYRQLHPSNMSLEKRIDSLFDLKKIGYQVGCGFMVGSPSQNSACLADDLLFIHQLRPAMVGLGPFIPHQDTKFKDEASGTAELTIFLMALVRLMIPHILLPATTALGSVDPLGREKGIEAGGNVVMPNLSPLNHRRDYLLYDNKICIDDEPSDCRSCINSRIESTGNQIVIDRGDVAL